MGRGYAAGRSGYGRGRGGRGMAYHADQYNVESEGQPEIQENYDAGNNGEAAHGVYHGDTYHGDSGAEHWMEDQYFAEEAYAYEGDDVAGYGDY